jgi:hypothetical protein
MPQDTNFYHPHKHSLLPTQEKYSLRKIYKVTSEKIKNCKEK